MRKFLSIILATLILVSSFATVAFAEEMTLTPAEKSAGVLQTLNLFKGTDQGFELDRQPLRIECVVTIIRLLGEEKLALNCIFENPFTDVPAWADRYVAYAYATDITKGISSTEFGYTSQATRKQFATLLLRALKYSEADKDFSYNTAEQDGLNYKIIDETINSDKFLRGDMVRMSYLALSVNVKDTDKPLSDSLIAKNIFTKDAYDKAVSVMGSVSEDKPSSGGSLSGGSSSGSSSSGGSSNKPSISIDEQKAELKELSKTIPDYYNELSKIINMVDSKELHAEFDAITARVDAVKALNTDNLSDSEVTKYYNEFKTLFDDMEILAITIAVER